MEEWLQLDEWYRMGLLGDDSAERKAWDERQKKVPLPELVTGMSEGNGLDGAVFRRGNPHLPEGQVGRRYLEVFESEGAKEGSGRKELVEAFLAKENPFTSRVMVNRMWHYLFGRGIVSTVDNFGVLGEEPSHPELLDWLALTFVEKDGWSMKRMIKRLVMSQAYRQDSVKHQSVFEEKDPEVKWLHRQRLRRLTAEGIRDSMLAVSGRLDRQMGGKSVPEYLTSFMQGRGRPKGGPLDGEGRRSVYLGVRRNFLSPFMLVFDQPQPVSTFGQRDVTNVPAQALSMLNDPFVHGEADRLAKKVMGMPEGERVEKLYWLLFSREVTEGEEKRAEEFLKMEVEKSGEAGGVEGVVPCIV